MNFLDLLFHLIILSILYVQDTYKIISRNHKDIFEIGINNFRDIQQRYQ